MSRICKDNIDILPGVEVFIDSTLIKVKGKVGELEQKILSDVKVSYIEKSSKDPNSVDSVEVLPVNNSRKSRSLWGTYKSIIRGMIIGVSEGYTKRIEIKGVGYRSSISGNILTLVLGKSHEFKYVFPEDIKCICEKPTLLVLSGASKQKIGQVASEIKSFLRKDPYKGKGIYEEGSTILRKEGKKK